MRNIRSVNYGKLCESFKKHKSSKENTIMSESHYSMLIQWSDEDQAYLVRLPDWERAKRVLGPVTHGDTYAEALEHGLEALEALIASAHKHNEPLPEPQT